jgi:hypothetical protein
MTSRPAVDELDLGPLSELLTGFAGGDDTSSVPGLAVEQMVVESPIELYIVSSGGEVELRGAPPIETTSTSFMPVLHTLRLCLVPREHATAHTPPGPIHGHG